MATTGDSRDYNLLWIRESADNRDDLRFTAEKIAQTWFGFPRDPTRPIAHSLNMDLDSFPFPIPVLPVKSSRKRRNRGYANLSNYNYLP